MAEHELIAAVTRVVREADQHFQVEGGSSRHWVRDHFLPGLEAAGLQIVSAAPEQRCPGCRTPVGARHYCDEAPEFFVPDSRTPPRKLARTEDE